MSATTVDAWAVACKRCHERVASPAVVTFHQESHRAVHFGLRRECVHVHTAMGAATIRCVDTALPFSFPLKPQDKVGKSEFAPNVFFCPRCQTKIGSECVMAGWVQPEYLFDSKAIDVCVATLPFVLTKKPRDMMHQLIEHGLSPAVTNPKIMAMMMADDDPTTESDCIDEGTVPGVQPSHRVKTRAIVDETELVLPSVETLRDYFERGHSIHGTMSTLREYQAELAIDALVQNTIVYLPTGCGKTLVAVAVIRIMKELNPKKKAVFLVPNVPLVSQQAGYLRRETTLAVLKMHGKCNDMLHPGRRREKLKLSDVFVATAQYFLNLVNDREVLLDDVCLLVFDEAHHASGNSPYCDIMQLVAATATDKQPRILALTASPFTQQAKSSSYNPALHELLAVFDAVLNTPTIAGEALELQSVFKKVQWVAAETCPKAHALERGVRGYLSDLRALVGSMTTDDRVSDGMWKHAGDLCDMSDDLEEIYVTQSKLRKLCDKYDAPPPTEGAPQATKRSTGISNELKQMLDHLRCIFPVLHSLRILGPRGIARDLVGYFKHMEESNQALYTRIERSWQRHVAPHCREEVLGGDELDVAAKVMQIARIIEASGFDKDSRAIVFVRRRKTAVDLAKAMESVPVLRDLHPTRFIGHNSYVGMPWEEEQRPTLDKFRSGRIRLLVATSVLEEGLDVPECSLVIRFDGVTGMTSLVQSRGRVRQSSGAFVVLCAPHNRDKLLELVSNEITMFGLARQSAAGLFSKPSTEQLLPVATAIVMDCEVNRGQANPQDVDAAVREPVDLSRYERKFCIILGSMAQQPQRLGDTGLQHALQAISREGEVQVNVVEPKLGLVVLESLDDVALEDQDHIVMYEQLCQRVQFELPPGDRFWCKMLTKASAMPSRFASKLVEDLAIRCTSMVRGRFLGPGTFEALEDVEFANSVVDLKVVPKFLIVDAATRFNIEFDFCAVYGAVVYLETTSSTAVTLYLTLHHVPKIWAESRGSRSCPNFYMRALSFRISMTPTSDAIRKLRAFLATQGVEVRDTKIKTIRALPSAGVATAMPAFSPEVEYALLCFHSSCCFAIGQHIPSPIREMIDKLGADKVRVQALLHFEPRTATVEELVEEFREYISREWPTLQGLASVPRRVILKVIVTPTRILFERPDTAPTNRVFRNYDPDQFMYVYFRDENRDRLDYTDEALGQRVVSILRDGIKIGPSPFRFLGCSLSQMRNGACVLTALDPDRVRRWVGELQCIRRPAKYLKRLGQVFSATRESIDVHPSVLTEPEDDIMGDTLTHVFTDGCGQITPATAEAVAQALQLKFLPSAFQIRLGGAKGVLAVSRFEVESSEHIGLGVKLRKSMVKFSSPHTKLEIVATASPYSPAYLTRQSIVILIDLGVAEDVFLTLQDEYISGLATMVVSEKVGFDELRAALPSDHVWALSALYARRHGGPLQMDPFHRHIIHAMYQYKLVNTVLRARIPVKKGRSLMGVADFTGTLNDGEVFVQYSERVDDDHDAVRVVCLEDIDVVVHRSPCHHPGDVRVLHCRRASDVHPDLRTYKRDCIVFPVRGKRPHPDECTGGDLDGDVYTVIWDERLVPPRAVDAMEPTELSEVAADTSSGEGPIGVDDLIDFFMSSLRNDILGMASIVHLAVCDADPKGCFGKEALKLAELCSREVDNFNSTKHLSIVKELSPKAYPDFLQNPDKPSYPSKKVLGKMYRRALSIMTSTMPPAIMRPMVDESMLVSGYEEYLATAELVYRQYKHAIRMLLQMSGAVGEAELATGLVIEPKSEYKADYFRFGERCRDTFYSTQQAFYDQFQSLYGQHSATTQSRAAAAWYFVAYSDMSVDHLLSFPWILVKLLISNKLSHERDRIMPSLASANVGADSLSDIMKQTASNLQLSLMNELDEGYEMLLHQYFDRLQAVKILQVKLGPFFGTREVPMVLFGSTSLLTFEDQSDLDVFIFGVDNEAKLRELEEYVTADQGACSVRLIDKTFVPVLSFSLEDKWAVEVSLSTGGPRKTAWFRAYADRYPFFWPAAYFLIKWGRAAGLIRRKNLDGASSCMLIPVGFLWLFLEFCIKHQFVQPLPCPEDPVVSLDSEQEMAHWRDALLQSSQDASEPSAAQVMLTFFQYYGDRSTPPEVFAFDDPIDEQNQTILTAENVEVFREKCYVALHQVIVSQGDLPSLLRHQEDHRRRITLSRAFSKHVHKSPEFFAAKILRESEVSPSDASVTFMQHPNALRPDLYVADVVGDGESVHRIAEKIERIENELRGGNPRRSSKNYHRSGCTLLLFEGAETQSERVAFQDYMGPRHSRHEGNELHQGHLVCFRNGSRWLEHATGAFAAKFMRQMVKLSHFESLYPEQDPAKAIIRFGHHYLIHLPWSFHKESITLATIVMLEHELERGRESRELYESVLVARREAREPDDADEETKDEDDFSPEEAEELLGAVQEFKADADATEATPNRRKVKALSLLKAADPRVRDRGVAHSFSSEIDAPLAPHVTDFARHMQMIHTSDAYQVSIEWKGEEFNARLSPTLELFNLRTRPSRWFSATLKMRQELTEDKSRMDSTPDIRFYVSSTEPVPSDHKLVRLLQKACQNAPNGHGILAFTPPDKLKKNVKPIRVSSALVDVGLELASVINVRHIHATTYQDPSDGVKVRVMHVTEYERPDEHEGFLRCSSKTEAEIVMPPLTPDARVDAGYASRFLRTGVAFVEFLRARSKLAMA